MRKRNVEAKRAARNIRNLSSAKRSRGVPDRSDDSRRQVLTSSHKIQDLPRHGIEEQSIHGEIAAQRIFPRGAELHRVGAATITISHIATEGRHLDLAFVATPPHDDDSEGGANRQRVPLAKTGPHLVGRRIGGDVVVAGLSPNNSSRTHPPAQRA